MLDYDKQDDKREVRTMPMNPEIKAQWVAALRSGEYKQAKHVLHNRQEDSYCCLGVLCDLAVKSGADVAQDGGYFDGNGGALPESVITWAGLDSSDPSLAPVDDLDGGEYWKDASSLNDEGMPFTQIADLINWAL